MLKTTTYAHLAARAEQSDRAGDYAQAIRFYRLAGQQATADYDNDAALAYLNRALELIPITRPTNRYQLLLLRESIYALQGDRQAQIRDLRSLEALADSLDDDQKRAEVALRQAQYKITSGDYFTATTILQLALQLAQQQQDIALQINTDITWGQALLKQGQYHAAQTKLNHGLAQARTAVKPNLEADALRLLGLLATDQNELAQAKVFFAEALPLYQKLTHRRGESDVLNNLADVHHAQGAFYLAQQAWEQAHDTYAKIGDQIGQARTLSNLGTMFMDLGAYNRAQTYHHQSLALSQKIGLRFGQVLTTINLALVHHHLSQPHQAQQLAQSALAIATDMENRRLQGFTFNVLGHIYSELQQLTEAADYYWQSLSIWLELELPDLMLEAYAGLARMAFKQDQFDQAQTHVAKILPAISQSQPLEGVESPFLVYLTCYQVLQATSDPQATEILQIAHQHLQARAREIRDEDLRQSFLEKITAHQKIVSAFAAWKNQANQ